MSDSILDYGWCKDDNETIKYYNLSEVHPVGIAVHSFILSVIMECVAMLLYYV